MKQQGDEHLTFLPPQSLKAFASVYPDRFATIRHQFADHPLLQIDRLSQLGRTLPAANLEYNLGEIDLDQHDERRIPKNNLTFDETLRNIDRCGSWICFRNVEKDPEYLALIQQFLGEVQPIVQPKTGPWFRIESFIIIASPRAVTPFHFDPQHVFLMQIKGSKDFAVCPNDDVALVPPQEHERYHHDGMANLAYDPAVASTCETVFRMGPGDAVYIPVKSPHWARAHDEVSVAMSITWRSDASDKQRRVSLVNRRLRQMGLNPGLAGKAPARDTAKSLAYKAFSRFGAF